MVVFGKVDLLFTKIVTVVSIPW